MDRHLLKVPDGWRDAAREIGIVVIGVFIALFANQVVDGWAWDVKIESAEKAMRKELLWDDGPEIYQRAALHSCLQAKLDEIRAAVESGKGRSDVVRLTDEYQLQYLSYDSVAHDAANASGVFAQMDVDAMQVWTNAYTMIPTMDRTAAKESADIARLHSLRRTGGPLSEDERDRLLEAVETVRSDELLMWSAVRFTLPTIFRLKGDLDPGRMNRFMTFAREHYGACVKHVPTAWTGSLTNTDSATL